ncbi:hypothetical protein [Anaerolinea sp.]|uniref:hypothetical protein n=1 Tax=Anaerolinea sp. TaxID=1872519 RepID=UPI002ACDCBFD|nr:hypothetical protein [Anaerolinea sp.]
MNPREAFEKALVEGPSDFTREIACQDPRWAYKYARDVDQAPRDDTRAAAWNNNKWGKESL